MIIKKVTFLMICIIFCRCNLFNVSSNHEKEDFDNYKLEIKQIVFGGSNNYFVIENGKITIYQLDGDIKTKKIFGNQIKKKYYQEIKNLAVLLDKLDSTYKRPALDGVYLEIQINNKSSSKKIVIENYSVKEVNDLFRLINKFIPRNKPVLYEIDDKFNN
jgi:hypothetical protein